MRSPASPPATASASPAPSRSSAPLLALLWRGRISFACVFVLVSGGIAAWTLLTPPSFGAEASLLVRVGTEYAFNPEIGPTDAALRGPSLAEMVNSEVAILSGRELAEQVVRQIGVAPLFPDVLAVEPDPERAIDRGALLFREATHAQPVLESSVIKVEFDHPDPSVAARAVNLLVERFVDKHVQVFGEEDAPRFQAELEEQRARLAEAEQALSDFKLAHGIHDLTPQRTALLGQQAELRRDLSTCEVELAALPPADPPEDEPCTPELLPGLAPDMRPELVRQRYELEREQRALAEPAAPQGLVQQLSVRALELELEERRLLGDYTESSRQVTGVRDELARVRAFLDGQGPAAGPDSRAARAAQAQAVQAALARVDEELELLATAELERQRQEARAHEGLLKMQRVDVLRRLSALADELRGLDENETGLLRLERAVDDAAARVAQSSARADEARIEAELDRERQINVRVVELAVPPVMPLGLPRGTRLALGAFAGLLAGAGSVVALDVFRSRV